MGNASSQSKYVEEKLSPFDNEDRKNLIKISSILIDEEESCEKGVLYLIKHGKGINSIFEDKSVSFLCDAFKALFEETRKGKESEPCFVLVISVLCDLCNSEAFIDSFIRYVKDSPSLLMTLLFDVVATGWKDILKKKDQIGIARLSPLLQGEANETGRVLLRSMVKSVISFALLKKPLKLPSLTGVPIQMEPSNILTRSDIFVVSSAMPADCRENNWSLLYSSYYHGKSWYQFSSCILYRGSTLTVIKEKSGGTIFGAFSNTVFELEPNFYGTGDNFIFKLAPEIALHRSTGYNGTHSLPNGLGFGGQLGYFGIWIDADFGKGSCKGTPMCSTYGNQILSAKEDFEIEAIEVWCVKEAEIDDRLMDKKSAMLANPEVMALLDMANKKSYHNYDEDRELEEERAAKAAQSPNKHQYVSYE